MLRNLVFLARPTGLAARRRKPLGLTFAIVGNAVAGFRNSDADRPPKLANRGCLPLKRHELFLVSGEKHDQVLRQGLGLVEMCLIHRLTPTPAAQILSIAMVNASRCA